MDAAFIADIKQRTDIVALMESYGLQLATMGARRRCLCPFHRDSQPSFYVQPQQGFFRCFGCGASGSAIDFVMMMEKVDFATALERLAERAGVQMPDRNDADFVKRQQAKKTTAALNGIAARWFHEQLYSPGGKAGLDYLRKRGFSDAVLRRFGVGWAPDSWEGLVRHAGKQGYSPTALAEAGLASTKGDRTFDLFRNRVMFPIIDTRRAVVGFGGRVLGDNGPKYLNSPLTPLFDKHKLLFGLNRAVDQKGLDTLMLVEGYMDVMALSQAGIEGAVAALGTAFGPDHAKLLRRVCGKVIVCFDGDAAGVKAALRSFSELAAQGLEVRVLRIPGGRDPDELIREEGRDAMLALMANAMSVPDFRLMLARDAANLATSQGRAAFAQAAATILGSLESMLQREEHLNRWVQELEVATGFSQDSLYSEISRAAAEQKIQTPPSRARTPATPATPEGDVPAPQAAMLTVLAEGGPTQALMDELEEEDFTHPLARRLFAALSTGLSFSAIIDDLPEGERLIATAALLAEVPSDRAAAAPQMAKTLRKERLREAVRQLTAQLGEAPIEQQRALLEKIQELNRQLAK